jgi:hypothetical protein
MTDILTFYESQTEPNKSCLLALRDIILKQDTGIVATVKYGMPCFCIDGKAFCYLWVHKKYKQPYILLVEGKHIDEKYLIQENRSRMKIMLIDPNADLPIEKIEQVLRKALSLSRPRL